MIDKALNSLVPNCEWTLNGNEIQWVEITQDDGTPTGEYETPNFLWTDVRPMPSKSQIEQAIAEQERIYQSNEYQRLRQPEYPPLVDLADALYWQSQGDESKMTAYLAAVAAVKDKYPKGV